MTTGIRRHRTWLTALILTLALGAAIAATVSVAQAADTPRRGGILLAVIGADPPSLDPHQPRTMGAQASPAFAETYTWPPGVPKYTPQGSSASTAIASRSTLT